MRVVYVSTLPDGGPVSHLLNLAPEVATAGADVRVLCGSEEVASRARHLGLHAEAAPLRNRADIWRAVQVWPRFRAADVVHTQDRRALLLCGAAARGCGATLVHTYHGLPEQLVGLPGRPWARPSGPRLRGQWLLHGHLRIEALISRHGALVVPSHALAGFLASRGFPVGRMYVVPSRIDIRRWQPGPPREQVTLAVAARLEGHKGIDILLDACARLAAQPPAVHLDIYGDGSLHGMLQRHAATLGIDVTFHGSVMGVRDRLLDADIFVLPSRGENLPITILEAMAAALPVVATRVGGIGELVDDGVTGLMVEPDDVDGLACALSVLVRDPQRRASMGREAARRVAERFDAADAGAEMLQLYGKLCASST